MNNRPPKAGIKSATQKIKGANDNLYAPLQHSVYTGVGMTSNAIRRISNQFSVDGIDQNDDLHSTNIGCNMNIQPIVALMPLITFLTNQEKHENYENPALPVNFVTSDGATGIKRLMYTCGIIAYAGYTTNTSEPSAKIASTFSCLFGGQCTLISLLPMSHINKFEGERTQLFVVPPNYIQAYDFEEPVNQSNKPPSMALCCRANKYRMSKLFQIDLTVAGSRDEWMTIAEEIDPLYDIYEYNGHAGHVGPITGDEFIAFSPLAKIYHYLKMTNAQRTNVFRFMKHYLTKTARSVFPFISDIPDDDTVRVFAFLIALFNDVLQKLYIGDLLTYPEKTWGNGSPGFIRVARKTVNKNVGY